MDKNKGILYNTSVVIFKPVDKVYICVICCCIMLYDLWAPDYHKAWGVWGILWHKDDSSGCTDASSVCVVCLVTQDESDCPHTHTHKHTGLYMHYNVSSSSIRRGPMCLQQRGVSSSTPSKRSFYQNHSPHSNLCFACASMLFGWSAEVDWIPTLC